MMDYLFPDMRRRSHEKELMDLPDVDQRKLLRTIRQFRLLNFLFSSSRKLIRKYFFKVMEKDPTRKYTLLDIGAGGCDIPVWTIREARRRKLQLSITALDNDKRILPVAYESIKGFPEIKIVQASALELERLGKFDFIFSNHFLHHLEWDDIEEVLRQICQSAKLSFIINDLKRSNWAYLGYTIFTGFFIRKSLAFYDGRLSIRRSFLSRELENFVQERFPKLRIKIESAPPARIIIRNN